MFSVRETGSDVEPMIEPPSCFVCKNIGPNSLLLFLADKARPMMPGTALYGLKLRLSLLNKRQ